MVREAETDEVLVRRFQDGDARAFDILVQRHQDRVYRLAMVFLKSPSDAADVTQEVFLRAFTRLNRFRFRAQLFTWLYSATKNVSREHNRRQRIYVPAPEDEASECAPAGETLDNEKLAAKIRALVARLPERQRDVILLRIFEELSVEETARAMRCRPGTVKALLHKAVNNLSRVREDEL